MGCASNHRSVSFPGCILNISISHVWGWDEGWSIKLVPFLFPGFQLYVYMYMSGDEIIQRSMKLFPLLFQVDLYVCGAE